MSESDGCVKFNTKTWHYKIVSYVFYRGHKIYGRTNLCPYMRAVVAGFFLFPFVMGWRALPYRIQDNAWIVQAEVIFLFLVMLTSFFVDWYDNTMDDIFPGFLELVGYGFLGGNLFGVIGGLVLSGAFALHDYVKDRPKKQHRTRGLIKTYIESKHDKICPCVEFVEDEEDLK